MELWIGTSGYVYPEWIGDFYPRGTTSAAMLPCYAKHFPLVELNFSFYQLPTSEQFRMMLARVPAAFRFIVKAHRSLTHEIDEKQLGNFCGSLQPMHERGQLLAVLCQFPQRYHCNDANRRWIAKIRSRLDGISTAVEFRHVSWDGPDVTAWLRDERITLVSVDVPDLPNIFPRKLVQAGNQIYVRFHSRRAASWYAAGHERYDYAYSNNELLEWVQALRDHAGHTERAVVVFNNCRRANAVINARQLMSLLSQTTLPFEIMAPPRREIEQGTLFEG